MNRLERWRSMGKGLFEKGWEKFLSAIKEVVNMIVRDVRYIVDTIMNLNPSVRIGILLAIGILVGLYYAPAAFLIKMNKIAGFIMILLFFVIMLGYIFFLFRSVSDMMDVGDSVHDTIRYTKSAIGQRIGDNINVISGGIDVVKSIPPSISEF